MSSLALSHVVPGGTAPGGALAYRLLTDEGVSGSVAAFGLASQGIGSAVVLNVLFWLALVISIPLSGYNRLYGFAALAGAFLLLAFFGTVFLLTRGQRHADAWLRRLAEKVPFTTPDGVSRMLQNVADRITLLVTSRRLRDTALGVGRRQLAARRGQPVGLPVGLRLDRLADRPARRLRARERARGDPPHARRPRCRRGRAHPHARGLPACPVAIATVGVLSWRLVNFWLPIPVGGGCYLSLKVRRRRRAL